MHRTVKEIEKQGIASAFLLGGNLHYTKNGFHIGATGICYSYSLPLHPNKSQLYKRFAPEGTNFWNASIDYGYISHRLTMQGEAAMGDCGVVATVNSMSYLFSEKWSLLALYRFYPYRYYAMYSNSFKAGSDVQDESGGYVGTEMDTFCQVDGVRHMVMWLTSLGRNHNDWEYLCHGLSGECRLSTI